MVKKTSFFTKKDVQIDYFFGGKFINMKIVVGLGNPGKDYEGTRHNLGFMFLDYIKGKYNIDINKKMLSSKISEATINEEKVVFVKPQTFMNLSGEAVQKVKRWYKVDTKDILVIFDDVDIPFGEVRYKINGSGGTHNGMKNIVNMLNSKDFPRLKIGIGGIKHEKQSMMDFVLQRFSNEQLSILDGVFYEASLKLENFLDNKVN